jgi:acetoin utilization protein AcuC
MNVAIQPVLIGSEIYRKSSFGINHPLAIPRVSTVLDLTRALGWCGPSEYKTAPRAKPKLLQQFHSQVYISALQSIERSQKVTDVERKTYNIGTLSNPIFSEMFQRPATSVGSSTLAAELVAGGGRAYAVGGGLHHGMAKHANGFCFLNDLVFAIRRLRSLGIQRIAYVDLDAHHCDGVKAAFEDDNDLLMVSTHEEVRWPFTGMLEDNIKDRLVNIPLPKACNDDEFLSAVDQVVLPLIRRFVPEALIIQGGADALCEDPLSRMCLSNTALWYTFSNLLELSDRVILTGGGGYNPWTVARLWTGFWAIMSGRQLPIELDASASLILRELHWTRNSKPEERVFQYLQDVPNKGIIRTKMQELLEHLKRVHLL